MAGRSVNKVILLGHLGKNAETKFTAGGTSKSTFSVATNRRRKKAGTADEWEELTDWHNIVMWKGDAIAPRLVTGARVYVEGRIETRSYEDKSGQKKYITEISCEAGDVLLLSDGGDQAAAPAQAKAAAVDPLGISDDDVPF